MIASLRRRAAVIAALVAVLWLVAGVDASVFQGELQRFGIVPRDIEGLRGIVFGPFLHTGSVHLLANTSALAVFGGLVILRSESHFWAVSALGTLVGGAGTWLFARAGLHVGASGVVFAYFGYLLFAGIFERSAATVLLSVTVFALWGGFLFGIVPAERDVSWEGHLFGLVAGALAAWLLARRRP